MNDAAKLEVATLGGGCFWCLEAALLQLKGVESVVSGYAGGPCGARLPQRLQRRTGHAEVVEVRFDPAVIDYRTLLRPSSPSTTRPRRTARATTSAASTAR
jgi:peptide-methionine (S)-S-oxide reductase